MTVLEKTDLVHYRKKINIPENRIICVETVRTVTKIPLRKRQSYVTMRALYSPHLKSVFAGRVSCCQGCPGDPNYAADSHNAPGALPRHVRQHLLGDGHRAQEVELHQGLIHVHVGVYAQGALAPATVVDQDVNLKRPWRCTELEVQKTTWLPI